MDRQRAPGSYSTYKPEPTQAPVRAGAQHQALGGRVFGAMNAPVYRLYPRVGRETEGDRAVGQDVPLHGGQLARAESAAEGDDARAFHGDAGAHVRRCARPRLSLVPVRVKWPELALYVKVAAELDLPR